MMGFDERDATSLQQPAEDLTAGLQSRADTVLQGLRIGVPRECFGQGLADDVRRPVRAALEVLAAQGAELVEISLPKTELAIPAYYVIAPAEASSNLSRFDGVRYGHRAAEHRDLADMYAKTRAEGFGAEVKRRILIGAYVLSHGYYDAYYLQAQKLRRLIADDFRQAFGQVDLIASPVSPTVAWNIGAQAQDPVANYLADVFTLPASLAGLPGLAMPAGFGAGGLPVGVQLIGNYLDEARLLAVAHAFQQLTDWHLQRPPAAQA
jgi:aspartyl-tRNA(Asn)/glutamyl-tRNA(Gln) amidotransferase subunit A